MNYFSKEITFTRGEVLGAAVVLMLLGLKATHEQRVSVGEGCAAGLRAGVHWERWRSRAQGDGAQPQETRGAARQMFAAQPSAETLEMTPYAVPPQGYGYEYGGGFPFLR